MQKTKTHLLIISLCALAVLAACETVPAPQIGGENGNPASEEATTGPDSSAIDNISADNNANLAAGEPEAATLTGGISQQDQQVMQEALEKQEEQSCEKMSTEALRTACRDRITASRMQTEQVERLQIEEDKMAVLRNSIQQSNDPQRCGELQDPNQVAGCELNILVNQAVQTGDLDPCSKASSENTQADCRRDAQELLQMVVPTN
jgi:hypothetical protein